MVHPSVFLEYILPDHQIVAEIGKKYVIIDNQEGGFTYVDKSVIVALTPKIIDDFKAKLN